MTSQTDYGENALAKHLMLLETRACRDGKQPLTTKTAIQGALADPSVFVFGNLLDHPAVKALASSSEHADWLCALNIFAYGTYLDYKSKGRAHFPAALNSDVVAIKKLKMLTVAEMASRTRVLSYGDLQSQLDLSSVRDLEDLLIDCLNENLVHGTLDQRNEKFHATFTFGRDLRDDQIDGCIQKLDQWLRTSEKLIDEIGNQIVMVENAKQKELKRNNDIEKKCASLKHANKAKKGPTKPLREGKALQD
eukprot:g3941.t1